MKLLLCLLAILLLPNPYWIPCWAYLLYRFIKLEIKGIDKVFGRQDVK